jgi:hypothetical protein
MTPTSATAQAKGVEARVIAPFALALLAAALPWELYQRLPYLPGTLVKVGGGLLILCALVEAIRRRSVAGLRTGFELPVGLYAVVCAISLAGSIDPSASLGLLRVYATYAALFYAVVWGARIPGAQRTAFTLFTLSAVGVALLSIACHFDLLKPTLWYTAFWPQQPLIEEWRAGLPMRIAGASPDFNQAALFLLLGFVSLVWLLRPRSDQRLAWVPLGLCALALLSGIVLTMSRSTLLLAVLVVLPAFARTGLRGRTKVLAVAVGVVLLGIVAVVVLTQTDFGAVLWERAQGGIVRDDGSARNRLRVYRAALSLVPSHLVKGAGLGATDAAMEGVLPGFGELGHTVHSTPLKALLETGLLGLAGYLWLWWRAMKTAARTELRQVAVGTVLCLFAVLLFQPFQALSVVPVMVGFAVARAGNEKGDSPRASFVPHCAWDSPRFRAACPAIGVVAIVVCANICAYQRTFRLTTQYGDALAEAFDSHLNGDFARADSAYELARTVAADTDLANRPYFDTASRVYDLPRRYDEMPLGIESPAPEALAGWGVGQMCLLRGELPEAAEALEAAAQADPRFAGAFYDLAEALDARGEHDEAAMYRDRARGAGADAGVFSERLRCRGTLSVIQGADREDAP